MLKRFARDESGMTMGLTVIMVVLIGVMGAGLLVFVQRDLNAVVEVNQGQRAFSAAEAGVEAAKRQLLSDAVPEHYGNGSDASRNIDWSYETTSGDVKTYEQMKQLTFDGKTIRVSVQYLPPVTEPEEPDSDQAPEAIPTGQTELPSGCRYFKVRAYGESGEARRGAEAIYCASQLDVPTAFYTPKSIEIKGNVDISGISFFAKEDITKSGAAGSIDRVTPTLYGDWDTTEFNPPSDLNTTGRENASGNPVEGAGLAAEGNVSGFGNSALGVHDYDKDTSPRFERKTNPDSPNPSGIISYPFNPEAEPDMDLLREEADRQGNYYPSNKNIDNTATGGKAKYPADSNDQTVFYMNGEGGDVDYNVPADHAAKGTIVVENGNIKMSGNSEFEGIMIITGNGTTTGLYKSSGTPELNGFVIADGNIIISGDVGTLTLTEDFTNRPGFYSVELWSWRAMYE